MSGTSVSTAGGPQSPQPCPGGKAKGRPRSGSRAKFQAGVSRDAQRVAAAVLEVLAGVRTPTEAAVALSLSVPRYYLWEQRALEGLVRACEPRPQGKAASQRHQMALAGEGSQPLAAGLCPAAGTGAGLPADDQLGRASAAVRQAGGQAQWQAGNQGDWPDRRQGEAEAAPGGPGAEGRGGLAGLACGE